MRVTREVVMKWSRALVLIAATCAVSSAAYATTHVLRFQPGVTCKGLYQNWTKMYREERGIANVDQTSAQGIVCPAKSQDINYDGGVCFTGNYAVSVYYDDESTVDNLFC